MACFFWPTWFLNNLNVLNASPVFNRIVEGTAPKFEFEIRGRKYHSGYYLADGIYPNAQEAVRKDVERAFGVLKARFQIIRAAASLWKKKDMRNIMEACIILHNMFIEDERDERGGNNPVPEDYDDHQIVQFERQENSQADFEEIRQSYRDVMNKKIHHQLQQDFIDNIWFDFGNRNS